MPELGTPELRGLLAELDRFGVPTVGVGRRWGPRVPQLHPPQADAPDLRELDRDVADWASKRCWWAQPGFVTATQGTRSVTQANRGDRLDEPPSEPPDHGVLWRGDQWRRCSLDRLGERWHPRRHDTVCMAAAAARHLDGASDEGIRRDLLELGGPGDRDRKRDRTVEGAVGRGSELWAALGGWPWAAFPGGSLPDDWSQCDEALDSLRALIQSSAESARRDAAAAQAREQELLLLAGLTSG